MGPRPPDRPATAPASAGPTGERVALALFAVAAAYAAFLGGSAFLGQWLVDETGRPVPYDFVNLWSAGRLALEGRGAEAYDYVTHKAAQVRAVGHDFLGYFPWPYPPHSMLVVAPFAILPYGPAFLLWIAATGSACLLAVRALGGGKVAILGALAWPATLWNASVGQNGFLTAALIGFALATLGRRPVVAGICIGLLTYKPQFGLLIPLALLAGGHGRAFAAAAATACGFVALSGLVLGAEPWLAFVRSVAVTNDVVLVQGQGDLGKMQTVFGLVRSAGGGSAVAWMAQGWTTALAAVWVVAIWRRPLPAELQGAVLAVATLLATPYAFIYDLVLLLVPILLLARRGLDAPERALLVLAAILILLAPAIAMGTAFGAVAIVGALVGRRCRQALAPAPDDVRARLDAAAGG